MAMMLPGFAAVAQETAPIPSSPPVENAETVPAVEASETENPAKPSNGETPPLPPAEQPLPPLIEPLPVPTVDGTTPIPPLDGTLPIPPAGPLTPLEENPLAAPLEEEATTTLGSAEDPSTTFEGDGFGGLPRGPSGFAGGGLNAFNGMNGIGPGANGGRLLAGFHGSASLSGNYSSNVNPSGGDDSGDSSDEGDFIMSLGGSVSYMSTAPRFTFGGTYSGNYSQYFSQSDLSGYSQSGGLTANYKSGPLYLSMNVGLSYDRGSNRYYDSEYVGVFNVSTGFNARYTLGPKTTVQGNIGTSFSSTSDGNFDNSGSFDAGLSGLYRYSSRTEFGPGVHYGYQGADGGDNARSSVGPTFTVNYKLSSLISVNSMVGVDFSSYEEGDSTDVSMTGSLGMNYTPSALWGMNLSIFKGVQPDYANSGGFIDTTSLSLGYHRQIRRATLSLGASYNFDSADDGGGSAADTGDDGGSWTLSSALGMGIFANTCQASLFANYSDQGGGSGGDSYSSASIGFSISRSF